ncbi:MAG: hypothetical protein KJ879_03285, partial [Nanoarchaeota archaeon]|nr:hypothetical protein [Nanoarchaeota archaeon]
QIALIIDSAEPVMAISLEMNDAVNSARDEGITENDAISINGNVVTVRLREGVGYSYSFFNDVSPTIKFDTKTKLYELFIDKK